MKKLYLECNMGAAGDMLMAALLELYPEKERFLEQMNSLGLEGVSVKCVPAQKCGINGSHINVIVNGLEEVSEDVDPGELHYHSHEHEHDHMHPHEHEHDHDHEHEHEHEHEHAHAENHSHSHLSYENLKTLIAELPVPEQVKADALAVYSLIGEAESHVHGVPVEQIHFHEVGSLDAIVDVVGCCLLFHLLAPDSVTASPVHVGSGFVRCAHGILPIPAPATAYILRGIPIYGGEIRGELCTPTGAALLKHFVSRFSPMPPMSVNKIGCGMGTKDFEVANCVRAFWAESDGCHDEISELSCNLDDMTPEAIGCAIELILAGGALDVFSTPIFMKKNRPSTMLTCLCRPDDKEKMIRLMLLHTTTLGVRETSCVRTILTSSFYTVETDYGPIRIKTSSGHGITKYKPEYADVLSASQKHGAAYDTVYKQAVAKAEKI
nr:nickel pincer cofactor biosynthesis protein LarC [uncultured Caproiciproducens sp.]